MTLLTSAMMAGALIRLAESQGGFGMVVAKGDPTAGAIAVVLLERGANARYYERSLQMDGSYAWQQQGGDSDAAAITTRISNRRRIDPDLWVVELDIASAERFAAEMNAFG